MSGALALQELPPITAYLDLLEPSVALPHHQADSQHSQQSQHANMQPTSVANPSESRPVRSRRESLQPSRPRAARTPPPSSIVNAIPPMGIVDREGTRAIENAVDLAHRALEEATSFARHSANRRSRERQRYQESSPPLSRRSIEERNNSTSSNSIGNSNSNSNNNNNDSGSSSSSSSSNSGYGSRPTILRPGESQSLYGWAPLTAPSTSTPQENTNSQSLQRTTTTSSSSAFEALLRRDILPRAPSPPRRRQNQASPVNAAPGSTPPPSRPLRQFTLLGNPALERTNSQSTSSHISQLPPRRWQEWLDAMNGYDDDRDATPAVQPQQPQSQRIPTNRNRATSNAALMREARTARKQPIEEAIKYLTRIQDKGFHWTIDEAEGLISCIYANKVPENCLDFITDTNTLYVAPTSWLAAGSIYTGAQYATHQKQPQAASFRANDTSRLSGNGSAGNIDLPPTLANERKDTEEHWNVTVVIQEVDHARNRISGSMRAYDVPDWQSATGTSSINTFWEGEIIDFHNNGLETLNSIMPSNPRIDGNYWKKLDPFAGYTDSELAQKLTSRQFLEDLAENYVLMRWKEQCFVEPGSQDSGLTITGFYFVSLARRTGHIEGYYYDPHSTPFQRLQLEPSRTRYFPAYKFR
ncbi:hypothetical protein H072_6609 [Dactylellina haptotyla CBS 200.50]|uniref:Vacuolar import and degradation protein-domain-containing protein n=1 Tax=Dactylellina haptotyla (strain CBS 200.50) TaxID=1284197 RepID=S8A9P1_DACHA|nr:hypothetical protein H072_6609 [Dactylellina haptotyla CBS 200.50]